MSDLQDTKYVGGVRKLAQRIATIRENLAVPPMVTEIGELLLKRTLKRFDDEVDPDGRRWTPLAHETLMRRRRNPSARGTKILNATGKMRASIKRLLGDPHGAFAVATGAGFRIGVADPLQADKARVHQNGTPRVPQRRFLGIGKTDITAVDGLLRRRAAKLGL